MSDALLRAARKPIYGKTGMVVSGHPAASQAGLRILQSGGSVVDAAIAVSACLTVLLGHATSIGGDCFALLHSARDNLTRGLNASGVAPEAATIEQYHAGIPLLGPKAVIVPGLVRAWERLYHKSGKLPWSSLFDAAIEFAESAPIAAVLAERIEAHREQILADPGSRQIFLRDDAPIENGELFRQAALARTLRAIADRGADEFYIGDTARMIASCFAKCGGLLTASDLAAYQPQWVDPIDTTYRGHKVAVMPPNSYGVLLLMQLNGLSAIPSEDLAKRVPYRMACQIAAMQEAFRQGVDMIADPARCEGSVAKLLSEPATLDMQNAVLATASGPSVPNRGGTSCLLIADSEGNAINVVQSVFHVFGSQFVEPQTGIVFNNRMSGFTSNPESLNCVGPGLRPPHTLCPVMVKRGGRLRYVLASPGGLSQTLTNVQVINQLVDCGHDVSTAVESPRWCNTLSGELLIEPEFSDEVVRQLKESGHPVSRKADPYYYGSAKAIEYLPSGLITGAADHRREAYAAGI